MRRLCAVLVLASCLVASGAARAATPPPSPPILHARAAAVINADTLQVIWQQNGNAELPMASLTKMMTALVGLRDLHNNLNAELTVPPAAAAIYGERVYLRAGQVYTLHQMLDAMLVQSANDAAITIAVNAAGSQRAFVAQMNAEARSLGLRHTHYVNVHGLDAPGHYSSALDLAHLGAIVMRNPIYAGIAGLTTATIPWPGHGVRVLDNHNYLLTGYPGANGVKIGYTSDALNCVVGSAIRDGHEVVAVVMGETMGQEWPDESLLLDYGFKMLPYLPPPVALALPAPRVLRSRRSVIPVAPPGRRPWSSYAGLVALAAVTFFAIRRPPR